MAYPENENDLGGKAHQVVFCYLSFVCPGPSRPGSVVGLFAQQGALEGGRPARAGDLNDLAEGPATLAEVALPLGCVEDATLPEAEVRRDPRGELDRVLGPSALQIDAGAHALGGGGLGSGGLLGLGEHDWLVRGLVICNHRELQPAHAQEVGQVDGADEQVRALRAEIPGLLALDPDVKGARAVKGQQREVILDHIDLVVCGGKRHVPLPRGSNPPHHCGLEVADRPKVGWNQP